MLEVKRFTDRKVKTVRSDNGGEFTSNDFDLRSLGIKHQTTVPYSSQQNRVAERANRTIVERAVLLYSERLPLSLWAEVMNTVVYLKNRSPTRSLKDQTPLEAYSGVRPDLSRLRVIRCAAWSLVRPCLAGESRDRREVAAQARNKRNSREPDILLPRVDEGDQAVRDRLERLVDRVERLDVLQ
jgi:hypothetical protein